MESLLLYKIGKTQNQMVYFYVALIRKNFNATDMEYILDL